MGTETFDKTDATIAASFNEHAFYRRQHNVPLR